MQNHFFFTTFAKWVQIQSQEKWCNQKDAHCSVHSNAKLAFNKPIKEKVKLIKKTLVWEQKYIFQKGSPI